MSRRPARKDYYLNSALSIRSTARSILLLGLLGGDASGLTIYRFGGASLPAPAESASDGVRFIQRNWSEVDAAAGGETFELDMDDAAIRALEHDPQVNIAPTVAQRGGLIFESVKRVAADGDTGTVWYADRYLCAGLRGHNTGATCFDAFAARGTVNIDLGGRFLIDRVRVVSGLESLVGVARHFRIHLAPEIPFFLRTPAPLSPVIVEVRDNSRQVVDLQIPTHQPAAFLQLQFAEHEAEWEIAEIEIYARGFVEKSTYMSNVMDFGGDTAWGTIGWSGVRDAGADVIIQTRSGTDAQPDIYWKNTGRGDQKEPVTRSQYADLKLGEKAGTTPNRDSWTLWSAPYDFADSSGAAVVSDGPRRFLQFRVDFLPGDKSGAGLDLFEIRASQPPVASELVGEVSPFRVEVGEVSRFTYVVKPTIEGDDTGFDRLELRTSSAFLTVRSVTIADVAVEFAVEALEDHRFEVSFPKVDSRYTGLLVAVEYDARVLRYGSSFDARVFDSGRPLEVHQGVNPGDAAVEFAGDRVSVATSVVSRSLLEATVAPAAFTPNGDGTNDAASIAYDLLEFTGSVAVEVEIRDLAGHPVRTLYAGVDPIGHHERPWDGLDDAGRLVPPGVYVFRVSVHADNGRADKIGTVHVVY